MPFHDDKCFFDDSFRKLRLLSEFVGTFLLVLTVGCNVLGGNVTWGGVSIAFVLMICIYAMGAVSGANFNPAVSVTLGISKAMGGPGLDWKTVGQYAAVQTLEQHQFFWFRRSDIFPKHILHHCAVEDQVGCRHLCRCLLLPLVWPKLQLDTF